jgi:hypothetical protein
VHVTGKTLNQATNKSGRSTAPVRHGWRPSPIILKKTSPEHGTAILTILPEIDDPLFCAEAQAIQSQLLWTRELAKSVIDGSQAEARRHDTHPPCRHAQNQLTYAAQTSKLPSPLSPKGQIS